MIQKLERNFQNHFNHSFGIFEHVSDQNWIHEQNDFNLDQCALDSWKWAYFSVMKYFGFIILTQSVPDEAPVPCGVACLWCPAKTLNDEQRVLSK